MPENRIIQNMCHDVSVIHTLHAVDMPNNWKQFALEKQTTFWLMESNPFCTEMFIPMLSSSFMTETTDINSFQQQIFQHYKINSNMIH